MSKQTGREILASIERARELNERDRRELAAELRTAMTRCEDLPRAHQQLRWALEDTQR